MPYLLLTAGCLIPQADPLAMATLSAYLTEQGYRLRYSHHSHRCTPTTLTLYVTQQDSRVYALLRASACAQP
jgi:hypothetical protein